MNMPKRGFTMIELLVVMAILGLLIALALAGVQSSRAAARRLDCSNRLHQLGVAAHAYIDVFKMTPPYLDGVNPWFKLVSFTESNPDGVSLLRQVPYGTELHLPRSLDAGIAKSMSRMLQCPAMASDIPHEAIIGGLLPVHVHLPGSFVTNGDAGGAFTWNGVRLSEIRDGLSKTSMASEVVVTADIQRSQAGDAFDISVVVPSAASLEELVAECRRHRPGESTAHIGRQFAFANSTNSLYSHTTSPGGLSCECDGPPVFAFVSAGSEHGNMVNVLLCDGSVQQYGYSIDLRIWKALGTRAGGDEF
jgi:prepilin-type N-terminal cleavage/methylation domain-containing protein/prepilin-type processing-associated H-X9-DG protein